MILKKGKPPDNINSYRPIFLLSCMAKWLEKIVNKKIQTWAESSKILPPCQSGFRKARSTQDHILRINQAITDGFNRKELTGAIFFDLEKAFDQTSHKGIITKLQDHGLDHKILNWIKSFLSDRSFQVSQRGHFSSEKKITCGVPQGSCLSPTIFILFFSDIAKCLPMDVKIALFADDLCIWVTRASKKQIEAILQMAVNRIIEFCNKWGFKINETKTCYTTFTRAGQRKNYNKTYGLNIKIENNQIPLEPNPTFLGIKLDPKLDYKKHLELIKRKQVSKINIIRTIKGFKWTSSIRINKILYKSLIRSLFDYCFVILQSGTQRIKSDLQKMQNRILRIIKYFPIKTSIDTIHKELKIEKLEERSNHLFIKFLKAKQGHDLIAQEIQEYQARDLQVSNNKFATPLDFLRLNSNQNNQ